MDDLEYDSIKYVTMTKPFKDFSIEKWDNSASTGYSNDVIYYDKSALDFLGKHYDVKPDSPPGTSVKLTFKFRPKRKGKTIIIIQRGRPWDKTTLSYTAYVVMIK